MIFQQERSHLHLSTPLHLSPCIFISTMASSYLSLFALPAAGSLSLTLFLLHVFTGLFPTSLGLVSFMTYKHTWWNKHTHTCILNLSSTYERKHATYFLSLAYFGQHNTFQLHPKQNKTKASGIWILNKDYTYFVPILVYTMPCEHKDFSRTGSLSKPKKIHPKAGL